MWEKKRNLTGKFKYLIIKIVNQIFKKLLQKSKATTTKFTSNYISNQRYITQNDLKYNLNNIKNEGKHRTCSSYRIYLNLKGYQPKRHHYKYRTIYINFMITTNQKTYKIYTKNTEIGTQTKHQRKTVDHKRRRQEQRRIRKIKHQWAKRQQLHVYQ